MTGLVLGIDPGRVGGAVLRDADGAVVGWWTWSSLGSGVRLIGQSPALIGREELSRLSLLDVGEIVGTRSLASRRGRTFAGLVVEGLFALGVGAQPLIEGCGVLMEGLKRAGIPKPIARPPAVARSKKHIGWRSAVLGLPNKLDANRAEAEAIRFAMGERGGVCWLPKGLQLAEQGAVAEAWAIAGFGFLVPAATR